MIRIIEVEGANDYSVILSNTAQVLHVEILEGFEMFKLVRHIKIRYILFTFMLFALLLSYNYAAKSSEASELLLIAACVLGVTWIFELVRKEKDDTHRNRRPPSGFA